MNAKPLFISLFTTVLAVSALTGCGRSSGADKYDKDGRLILNLKNVYFAGDPDNGLPEYDGGDIYTEAINERFGVKIKPSSYSYGTWDDDVNISVTSQTLPDVIHYNLKAYNFGASYEKWVQKYVVKALPDDMSKWPNIKKMLDNTTNLDALKINGKLYGLPIANDISNPTKDYSNFTYVYRRDWAKAIDAANASNVGYKPIYREGDVYTWEEFNELLKAFKKYVNDSSINSDVVLVDQPWGFPSITNFYKTAPHCFAKDASGKAINNFTSDEYIQGLDVSKNFVKESGYYSPDQYLFTEENGRAYNQYKAGLAGVFYDNLGFTNYAKLRKAFKLNNKDVNVDDGVAFLKIKGPDGKYAIEGIENWFAMTMFNYDISDKKMNKVLDILDYLLSEEGTMLSVYGLKDYDYTIVDGKVVLSETGWEKDEKGNYIQKINGAKSLRYMVTLGNDYKSYDPYTEADKEAFDIVNAWQEEMKAARAAGQIRVVQEPGDIAWMSTPTKNEQTQGLLKLANSYASKYCFDTFKTIDAYKSEFDKDAGWKNSLKEINEKLGK